MLEPRYIWHQSAPLLLTVPMVSKQDWWGAVNASSSATSDALMPLLHVKDLPSNMQFLVDNGASVSILLPTHYDRRSVPPSYDLLTDNGTPIATYGSD